MKKLFFLLLLILPAWSQESIPFQYLPGSDDGLIQGHLISIPVTVGNGTPSRFILDTGIGIDLISTRLAQKLKVASTGISYKGKRMSGQEVEVPLSYLGNLTVGRELQKFGTVGVWDFKGFLPDTPAFADIDGFLGLRFFQHRPFTLDYRQKQLILETPITLQSRVKSGIVVPLEMDDDQNTSLTVFAPLEVSGAEPARVEIDTGSDSLILHRRFMAALGIPESGPGIRVVQARDETDFAFTRWFTKLPGNMRLNGDPKLEQNGGRVMFQQIIHDGLIGDEFLKHFIVTFDLSHSRMILQRPD
ncbi:MAG: aspartyl protease family protein [Candidatus Eremiobacteraeota bacterium]|nr:aspartyl protease family protein [Candidatus Eremiobacteraeota bacterium]MCW5870108.1 aspartyl protease family protein [Candidatus Eremiobacteraeota bacterium]